MEGEPGDLMTKIYRSLFGYLNTQHSATGQIPAILLNNRPLRSRLDLLLPSKEKKQSTEESSRPKFNIGQNVLSRDFRPTGTWQKGVVSKQLGKFLYEVTVDNIAMKRHVDQLLPASPSPHQAAKPSPDLLIKVEIPETQLNTEPLPTQPTVPDTPASANTELLPESRAEEHSPPPKGPKITRSGRVIRWPIRFRDDDEEEETNPEETNFFLPLL